MLFVRRIFRLKRVFYIGNFMDVMIVGKNFYVKYKKDSHGQDKTGKEQETQTKEKLVTTTRKINGKRMKKENKTKQKQKQNDKKKQKKKLQKTERRKKTEKKITKNTTKKKKYKKIQKCRVRVQPVDWPSCTTIGNRMAKVPF